MESVLLIALTLFMNSCMFTGEEYRKLMDPIKKIKLEEQRLGKVGTVYDGIAEPSFPDENENNRTLKGVDSNQDGIRDDIEIWINRKAEDDSIRWGIKDLYKKIYSVMFSIYNNEPEKVVHSLEELKIESLGCLVILMLPYEKKYLNRYQTDPFIYLGDSLFLLYGNSPMRKSIIQKYNQFKFEGTLGGRDNEYCKSKPYSNEYLKRLNNVILINSQKGR